MVKNLTKKRKKPTSYDVAELAGVSQSAVSRCFKAGASVSDKTRAKVKKAADKLGYQPNAIARGLITQRSNIVAVIINNQTNLYYPELLFELNQSLAKEEIHILLFALRDKTQVDQVLDQVWQYQVDGIIAATQFNRAQIDACINRQIPVVFFNRTYQDGRVSSVCCDHEQGEVQLVSGLLQQHRKKFLVINGPPNAAVSALRSRGAIDCIEKAQCEYHCVSGDYSYVSGQEATRVAIDKMRFQPDAVVCANDAMALGCMDTLRYEYQFDIPKDIAVVGFDGVAAIQWKSYQLTTIEQPIERMVEALVEILVGLIESPDLSSEKRLFSGKLIVGASAPIDM